MSSTSQKGHIDNLPVTWILFVLGVFVYLYYRHLHTGESPLRLLEMISPLTWWFLAALAVVVIVGGILVISLRGNAIDRELHSFPFEGSTIITLRRKPDRIGGGLIVMLGSASIVFGLIGRGWDWWIVAAAGLIMCALGLGTVGQGLRWVLAKDQVRYESTWYGKRTENQSWVLDAAAPPHFSLRVSHRGGAFGQPLVKEYCVMADDRALFTTTDRERATAFAQVVREAYPDAKFVEELH